MYNDGVNISRLLMALKQPTVTKVLFRVVRTCLISFFELEEFFIKTCTMQGEAVGTGSGGLEAGPGNGHGCGRMTDQRRGDLIVECREM
jgi:hypothetical protein